MNLETQFSEAFARGQSDRAQAQTAISTKVGALKTALEKAGLTFFVETTDYDGLFFKTTQSAGKPGWWAYLTTNTTANGLMYTVRAGFGQKNNPELRDALPDETFSELEAALQSLETALVKGVYYLGLLKR
jgi:hypothetical protein